MLSTLMKKHLIAYQLIPVVGYNDLLNKYNSLSGDISNVVLLGCGGIVDLESFLDIDPEKYIDQAYLEATGSARLTRKIYVIDGNRPWNLDNLFGSQIVQCLDDGSVNELEGEKIAYNHLLSEDENELNPDKSDTSDTENDDEPENSHSQIIENYYNRGTSFAIPVSIQTYSLLSAIGETDVESLWLSIVGTESVAQTGSIRDRYVEVLKDEVLRLNHETKCEVGIEQDYALFLMRHWNLYNSFFYSSYVNSKLLLYTSEGKKNLANIFAKMGISLSTARQSWYYLDVSLKRKLPFIFGKYLRLYDLDHLVREGFVKSYGFQGSVSACEFLEASTALLEHDGSRGATDDGEDLKSLIANRESSYVANFWKAFDSLSDIKSIKKGIKIAKWQRKFIFDKGFEIFEKKMIKNLKVFRLVVLKNEYGTWVNDKQEVKGFDYDDEEVELHKLNASGCFFSNPLILSKLGHWILESCAELDNSMLPLVIASLDPLTQTYILCGLPPKFPTGKDMARESEKLNRFSLAFQKVANSTNVKVRIDSFESCIIEIGKEDLAPFLERLTLSGLI